MLAGQKFRRVSERTLTAASEPLARLVNPRRFHRPAGNFAPREFGFLRTLNPFTYLPSVPNGKYFKGSVLQVENECVFE